ncbi:MAG: VacB/RNase II family 3'-5' exoribonuclease [Kiritimatiellae bacterium]|nr:VacB/RNase II family 3'-5' exoribonuclease [Kiritimatiellia bacterium]
MYAKRKQSPKGADAGWRPPRADGTSAPHREKKALVKGRTAKEDVLAVMRAYELPSKFPAAVKAAARRAAARMQHPGKRLDLRKKFIFTCDPVTAKDYDDALSLETDRKGNRVLGVHIADVSHFVTPGSPLDCEAYKRSTSVYLQNRVVPMLPEELCNGVCSLVPNEDRLAFSAFLTFDKQGRMIARKFAKSVIRSKARFTYEQVMAVLAGGGKLDRRSARVVRGIGQLAQQLRANRFAEGALDLDVPETEILLDDEGEMTGLELRVNDESHQMVEECMVAANEAVAKELWTRGVRILARLHETPDPEKLEELRGNLGALGVRCGDLSHGKNMARFLASIKTHPLAGTLAVMVLRSMKRACYDARKIGHFGLAKTHYAHFTSPIRRYPDLTLHRQLAAFVAGENAKMPQNWLDRTAEHCSAKEEAADGAERMLDEIKKYRYLEERGGTFDATVGKVAPFGLFVDVPALAVSGMVHVSRLSRRYVKFDESTGALGDGRRSWRLGDKIKVRVLTVDWGNRWIDFEGVDAR